MSRAPVDGGHDSASLGQTLARWSKKPLTPAALPRRGGYIFAEFPKDSSLEDRRLCSPRYGGIESCAVDRGLGAEACEKRAENRRSAFEREKAGRRNGGMRRGAGPDYGAEGGWASLMPPRAL